MKITQVTTLSALVAATFLASCAKKEIAVPPPPPPPPPPVVEVAPPPPPPPPPPPVDTNVVRRERLQGLMSQVLKPVYFDLDQSTIKPEGKDILKQIGDLLKAYPELSVTVEGNCDERGSTEYNQALGERRANAATSWLKNYGVKSSQFSAVSFGEERPASQGTDESAWSQNRRDEFPGQIK
jgi:peptidoglycan-associated lipoprotein